MSQQPQPSQQIGIAMCELQSNHSTCKRAEFTQTWAKYMAYALPDCRWIPLPSLGKESMALAQSWDLDGLVITGTRNTDSDHQKDTSLLNDFLDKQQPVFAVAQGMELLQTTAGGSLTPIPDDAPSHIEHPIRIQNDPADLGWNGIRAVTSDHNYGIPFETLHESLYPLATTKEQWVEAVAMRHQKAAGVLWHPERETSFNLRDRALIRWVFSHPPL
ncbi:MAG TPA: hypothetical protein ENJ84_13025 [Gammaproteobacteria bacterium]|nr:hypothetical protein [Gammaproteobacteria bacterium]